MSHVRPRQKHRSIRWRFAWAPMLFVALGFHAFLLFFPFQTQKKASQQEGESVKLTRLTTLKASDKQPSEKKSELQKVTGSRSLVVKAPPPPPPAKPKPAPSPVVKKALPKVKSSTSPKANKTAAQVPKLTQEEQGFVKRLQDLEGREVTDPVSSTLFPNPEFFYKDPIKELGKPGVVGIEYISFQKPDDVYNQLTKLYPDYRITPQPEYANGSVYQFKKGNFIRYVSLVRAQLGAGTLVVLWNREPS
ncbi:MAG: hypothetical protein IGS48_02705 [Oscillatoriales cyanobacterium C42_A2020_001]|nr:hypothetical protein [Leptolyngbyaceae cyanobacterium C42_A2020_001]